MQQATVRRQYGAHMLMALELALLPNVLDHEGIDESENPNEWHDWAISEASSRTVNARKSGARGSHEPSIAAGPVRALVIGASLRGKGTLLLVRMGSAAKPIQYPAYDRRTPLQRVARIPHTVRAR